MNFYAKILSLVVYFATAFLISAQQPPAATVSPVGVAVALVNGTAMPPASTAIAGAAPPTNGTRGGCGGKGKKKENSRESRDVLAALKPDGDNEPQPRQFLEADEKVGDSYPPHLKFSKRSPKKSDDSSSEETKDTSKAKPKNESNSTKASTSA